MSIYQTLKNADIEYGLEQEVIILEQIRLHFEDESIIKTEEKFNIFDFHSVTNNIFFELKSRKFELNKYPTTMIGINKIKKAHKTKTDIFLLFNFTDCLTCIKYNEELFKTFEIKKGGRQDRNRYEYSNYIYIPIEYLIKI